MPVLLDRAAPTLAAISRAARGVPVVLGIQRTEGPRIYNSLAVVEAGGAVTAFYDKHHLVPFGEYMPFGDLLARFGIYGLAANEGKGYSAGPGARLVEIAGLGRALPLICYEGVFRARSAGRARVAPDFLLLITNDAWFGKISGPYQHLAQARLRSAEMGLPMIRVANTGVSAMIDATGRVTEVHPAGARRTGATRCIAARRLPRRSMRGFGDAPMLSFFAAMIGRSSLRRNRARPASTYSD